MRIGGIDAAIAFYDGALRSLPDLAEIHCNRGALLARQRRFGEARAAFERAIALKPDWAPPRALLAQLLRDAPRP